MKYQEFLASERLTFYVSLSILIKDYLFLGAGSVNKSPGVSRSSTGGGGVSRWGVCDGWEATGGIGAGAAGAGIEAGVIVVDVMGTPKIAARTTVPRPGTESLSGVHGSP